MIGTPLGSYRITAKIAEGGMGTVYRAEHTVLGKTAAIKILHPELSHNRSIVDRFFNEAKATTAIRHPGIVEVFDFGYLQNGAAFLVMEFLDGEPLSRYLKRRGRIPEAEAAWLIRGMCSALAAAHAKSIVHRDLKPDNVFMVPDSEAAMGVRPKLLDFGIAKLSGSEISSSKTRTGLVMGTPTYMSPEQCKGTGEVDHRADLYSLGCMLYEMLCGRPPFVSEGAGELIGAHLFVAPDSPRVYAPQVSPAMEALVLRLLAKHREQRPASATELAETLSQLARASGGGWQSSRVQTPVRGVPHTGPLSGPVAPVAPPPAANFLESTQPMGVPMPESVPAPRPRSRGEIADEATVMEPMHVPPQPHGSWPGRQAPGVTPHPPLATPHHPMPTPHPPHHLTPPPMPTPAPVPTPPPQTVTTLSGSTAVRQGQGGTRTRWPIAIGVVLLFAAASAATTYLIVMRRAQRAARTTVPATSPADGTTPPPVPATTDAAAPAATVDAAPAEPLGTTADAAPPPADAAPAPAPADAAPVDADPGTAMKKKHRKADQPGSVIDLDAKKKRKKPEAPPGPIETDI